jgi:hypothetical protein
MRSILKNTNKKPFLLLVAFWLASQLISCTHYEYNEYVIDTMRPASSYVCGDEGEEYECDIASDVSEDNGKAPI